MGLFGGNSASKKASREIRSGINQGQRTIDDSYAYLLNALPGQFGSLKDILTQGRGDVLDALSKAYGTSRENLLSGLSALGSGYNQARTDYGQGINALNQGYGQARNDINSSYNTSRGDIKSSLASQIAAINAARNAGLGYYQPYMQGGQQGLNNMVAMTKPGSTFYMSDPGYKFRLNQGQDAIQNSAAGRGGALGGNTLKALQENAQGLASNEFNNAYARNQSLANIGLGASQGAAGLQQWAGTANAAANQWAGNQNVNNNQWAGNNLSGIASQQGSNLANMYGQLGRLAYGYGQDQNSAYGNLANLASQYGNNQANTMQNYNNSLLGLTNGYYTNLNDLNFNRAKAYADYDMQRANASANREASQQGGGWKQMLGTIGGGLLGSIGGPMGAAIGSRIGGSIGGGQQNPNQWYPYQSQGMNTGSSGLYNSAANSLGIGGLSDWWSSARNMFGV